MVSFHNLGALLGRLSPRCSDPQPAVRTAAIDCIYTLIYIQLRYEGIESCTFTFVMSARNLLFLYYSAKNTFLRGFLILTKSWKLTHMLEVVKLAIWFGSQDWRCQNGSITPPTTFQWSSPCGRFRLDVQKLLGMGVYRCIIPISTKNYHDLNPTGSQPFWSYCSFCRWCTLSSSLWVLLGSTSDRGSAL